MPRVHRDHGLTNQSTWALQGHLQNPSKTHPVPAFQRGIISAVLSLVLINLPSYSALAAPDSGVQLANDLRRATEAGRLDSICKSASREGITFQVEGVVADSTRTAVFYTIHGPKVKSVALPLGIDSAYNAMPFSKHGTRVGWDGHRWVGTINLDPLPYPVSLVKVRLRQVAGVKGDWSISFWASRSAADSLTRVIHVNQALEGAGYALHVGDVLLTPTSSKVEMSGRVSDRFDLRGVELVADGKPVPPYRVEWAKHSVSPSDQIYPMTFHLAFNSVDEGTKDLALSLKGAVRWFEGGPVLNLAGVQPQVKYGGIGMVPESVKEAGDHMEVAIAVAGGEAAVQRAWTDLRDWVLVDKAGSEYHSSGGATFSGGLRLTFPVPSHAPIRLEARQHAEEATSGSQELPIPLR